MAEVIAGGLLAMGAVIVGALLGVFVDRARWRREWRVSQVNTRVQYHADLLAALCARHVLLEKAAGGEQIRHDEAAATSAAWLNQLARGFALSSSGVQLAVARYDQAQGAMATAVNGGDAKQIAERQAELDSARLVVLAEVQKEQNDSNSALGRYLLSPWEKLRGAEPWKLGQADFTALPPAEP